MSTNRALRVVSDTGEIVDLAALQRENIKLTGERERAEGQVRRLLRLTELYMLDKELARQREPKRPTILDIYAEWQEVCKHGKAICDDERYDVICRALYMRRDRPEQPFPERRYPRAAFSMAIAGAAYDPYRASKPGRNGRVEVYDDISTIFGTARKFDAHIRKAPAGWLARYVPRPPTPDQDPEKLEKLPAEVLLYERALVIVGEGATPADVEGVFDELRRREPEQARPLLARLMDRFKS